ncbi:hypothetical protein L0B53_16585 [Vibrio sp. SS-MA-C1-2]|uniref:hypothetical protein n=1 Tax=Vibrio sp. SS-MA-C1-2 TaxID=2908646 RepID=UPI001F42A207|nr:hypothetical protein [Vibrio sp. SS-MA-C1-2]UJF18607.1 hypothetical protein L0B53_16585 [Vibrio sp. SS-MA-C1-2]
MKKLLVTSLVLLSSTALAKLSNDQHTATLDINANIDGAYSIQSSSDAVSLGLTSGTEVNTASSSDSTLTFSSTVASNLIISLSSSNRGLQSGQTTVSYSVSMTPENDDKWGAFTALPSAQPCIFNKIGSGSGDCQALRIMHTSNQQQPAENAEINLSFVTNLEKKQLLQQKDPYNDTLTITIAEQN